jgi:two-component system, OmpR family, response regulator
MKQAQSQRTEPDRFLDYAAMDKKIKIFVVEDSDIYRELIASFIYTMDRAFLSPEESNFEIRSFSTGEHCVAELDEKPDIIVLDYFLDGYMNHPDSMNGMETLRKIKKLSKKTHVVVVTSNRDIALANEFIVNGASDYVSKEPGVREKLQHSVARLIRIIRQERGETPDTE